jgi:RNA polymerase sigma-70 factor, ECF subfamily
MASFIMGERSRDITGAMQPALAARSATSEGEIEHRGISPVVKKARAGDPPALESLVRQELPRVERLLRRLLGRRSDMEDLVQTVFLEMCRALPGFRGQSSVSTFVGGIAVQVARRAMRPTAWARLRAPMPEQPASVAPGPESAATTSEQLRRLDTLLAEMSPDKRIAFALWAFEGMDVATIAETTGASVSATRSRIFYAQKELYARATADPYLRELVEGHRV